MNIPCISLWQPWASLIRPEEGYKTIETRHWPTRYRGPLAIHAAKKMDADIRDTCLSFPFYKMLKRAGFAHPSDLPLGCVVAVCNLSDCVPSAKILSDCTLERRLQTEGRLYVPSNETMFGNYAVGRFGWILDGIQVLAEPIPLRGQQGLWTADLPVEAYFGTGAQAEGESR